MLKIELFNQETNKKETFIESFVSARSLRQVVEFGVKQEKGEMTQLESLDELVSIVASIFKDVRVNFDTIYDGIEADKVGDVLEGIITDVMGGEVKKKTVKSTKK